MTLMEEHCQEVEQSVKEQEALVLKKARRRRHRAGSRWGFSWQKQICIGLSWHTPAAWWHTSANWWHLCVGLQLPCMMLTVCFKPRDNYDPNDYI